jgi:hypothetical protein
LDLIGDTSDLGVDLGFCDRDSVHGRPRHDQALLHEAFGHDPLEALKLGPILGQ